MSRTYKTSDGAWVTKVLVVEQEQYNGGGFVFDGSLADVRASLEAIWTNIPEAYRDNAQCEISSVGGYENSHYASIEVTYIRPATDEEIAAVAEVLKARLAQTRRAELAAYEALRAKYGDKS